MRKTLVKLAHRLAQHPLSFHYLRKLPELNYSATKARLRVLLKGLSPQRVLDAGCGTGEFAHLCNPTGYVGIDVHAGYVHLARRMNSSHRFECADVITWEGRGERFDLVLINGVLHHLGDPEARGLLETALRHASRGGTLLLVEDVRLPNAPFGTELIHWLDEGEFIRTPEAWRDLVETVIPIEQGETFRSGLCAYYWMLCRVP
jgi:2-polyprenyl-3-methyl-5-hydroxy-6-metoxy-1,4-benzoquinol methylase